MSKIGNTVIEVSKGIELNEKDYCMCLLTSLKEMEKNYVIAMSEASNEWLYDKYKDSFMEISNLQRKVYTCMFRYGWYQLETVADTKLDEKYTMLDAEYKGLSE